MQQKTEVDSSLTDEEKNELAIRQLRAGICLINKSGLLEFDNSKCKFVVVSNDKFEFKANDLDPQFGRVMLWLWFSTGAEYLLKGYIILQDPNFLKDALKPLPLPPAQGRDDDWAQKIISQKATTAYQTQFGTLQLADGLKNRLVEKVGNGVPRSKERAIEIEAIYSILRSAIRNRDSHGYQKDVRREHFHMIEDFAPAFNDLFESAGVKDLLAGPN